MGFRGSEPSKLVIQGSYSSLLTVDVVFYPTKTWLYGIVL